MLIATRQSAVLCVLGSLTLVCCTLRANTGIAAESYSVSVSCSGQMHDQDKTDMTSENGAYSGSGIVTLAEGQQKQLSLGSSQISDVTVTCNADVSASSERVTVSAKCEMFDSNKKRTTPGSALGTLSRGSNSSLSINLKDQKGNYANLSCRAEAN